MAVFLNYDVLVGLVKVAYKKKFVLPRPIRGRSKLRWRIYSGEQIITDDVVSPLIPAKMTMSLDGVSFDREFVFGPLEHEGEVAVKVYRDEESGSWLLWQRLEYGGLKGSTVHINMDQRAV